MSFSGECRVGKGQSARMSPDTDAGDAQHLGQQIGSHLQRPRTGTVSGGRLRMRGLGLPREDGTRGDLYAAIRVQVPSPLPEEERAAWEQLARESKFKPRKNQ